MLAPSILSGGGGESWSTRVVEISNDLSDSKRRIGKIGQRGLVQVQNRYSPTGRFGRSLAAATTSSSTAYSPFVVTAAFMGSDVLADEPPGFRGVAVSVDLRSRFDL